MSYPNLGGFPIIVAADLLNMQSNANKSGVGNARVGAVPNVLGKRPGQRAWRDAGGGDLSLVFATGPSTSAAWRAADGSTSYTPLNLATWTVGDDSTYVAGLLTTDGGNDAAGRVTQTVTALAAGTYILQGAAAGEGDPESHTAPRIQVTGATDGSLATKIYRGALHPTAAEDASPTEEVFIKFTLTVAQNVVFTLDVVDEDGALAAGSAFIALNPLEAA